MSDPNLKFYLKTDLKILRVTGEKAALFLHGQLSNSIKDLPPGCGNFNLLLNVKGKVQAACHVLNRGDRFDLIATPDSMTKLGEQLVKLATLSRCQLCPAPETVFHLLNAVPNGWPRPELRQILPLTEGAAVFRSDRLGQEGYDIIADASATGLVEKWAAQGFVTLTEDEAERLRIKNGVPRIGVDVTDTHLPQEALLDHALHFNKGCYLGQEVIARLHYKGHVNKILAHFRAQGGPFNGTSAIKNAEGAELGPVTSRAYDPDQKTTHLLGYVPAKEAPDTVYFIDNAHLERLR